MCKELLSTVCDLKNQEIFSVAFEWNEWQEIKLHANARIRSEMDLPVYTYVYMYMCVYISGFLSSQCLFE